MTNSVRRTACALAVVFFGVGALAGWPSAQQPGRPTLTVPDGFEVVRVAGPPLVERPIVADFDEERPPLRRRVVGLEREGRAAARRAAAPHPAPRGRGRRRRLRSPHGVRRSPDAARGHHVVRRVALRRGAAEHLEADRHRRRWRRGRARGVVPGQDADRLRQRPARAVSRARTAGSTGPRAPSPSRPTSAPGSRRSSPRPRTSSGAAPVTRPSSRC